MPDCSSRRACANVAPERRAIDRRTAASGERRSPCSSASRRTRVPFASILAYGAGNFAFSLLGLVVAVNLQFFYTDYVGLSAGLVAWSLLFARRLRRVRRSADGLASRTARARASGGAGRRSSARRCRSASRSTVSSRRRELRSRRGSGAARLPDAALHRHLLLWTVGAIPYYSLGAELTDDYHERTRVIAVREALGTRAVCSCATILPAYLIDLCGGRDGYSVRWARSSALGDGAVPVRRGRACAASGASSRAAPTMQPVPRHRARPSATRTSGGCSRRSRSRRSRARCRRRS